MGLFNARHDGLRVVCESLKFFVGKTCLYNDLGSDPKYSEFHVPHTLMFQKCERFHNCQALYNKLNSIPRSPKDLPHCGTPFVSSKDKSIIQHSTKDPISVNDHKSHTILIQQQRLIQRIPVLLISHLSTKPHIPKTKLQYPSASPLLVPIVPQQPPDPSRN